MTKAPVWVMKTSCPYDGKGVYVAENLDEVMAEAKRYLQQRQSGVVTIEARTPLGPDGGGR